VSHHLRRYTPVLWVLFVTMPLWSQTFLGGIKVGVPLTDYFETGETGSLHGGAMYSSATRRYTVGASFEWRLTNSFGFEVDGMFHRLGYSAFLQSVSADTFTRSWIYVTGDSWDFPVMAKYRFGRRIRPYIAGGGVLRYIGPVHLQGEESNFGIPTNTISPLDTGSPTDLAKRFYPGITAAGGVEFPIGHLRLLPELRYTHWTANISGQFGVLRFAPNQVEILLGMSF
jgi:hypothetical protein